ncbi:MAG: efflux RND transporter periplasmic adaptor subunit [Pseudomonadota bacterium]
MKKRMVVALAIAIVAIIAAAEWGYYLWREQGAATGQAISAAPAQRAADGQAGTGRSNDADMLRDVSLSPAQLVMANVATVEARMMPLTREINAVGIVAYDQARQAKVTAWVAGRIDRLHVNTVGAHVSKGAPVAEVYSPDLVSSQQEYLLALHSREQFKDSPIPSIAQGGEGLVESARQRLKLLGVKDYQIAALERSGQPTIRLPVYTPLSGTVIEKIALEGQYVNVGDPLFAIADLSVVWVEVEVYENEFPFIRIGQQVKVFSQSYPDRTFMGRAVFVYPFLDPKTRTVKVRLELPNPRHELKADMFVNAVVQIPLGDAIAVPVTAVLETGKRRVVWVEKEPGMFEPREVNVGTRVGDRFQILTGLRAGEKVAASGGYMIDSELQLRGSAGMPGMAGMTGMGDDKKPAVRRERAAPPQEGAAMGDMKM